MPDQKKAVSRAIKKEFGISVEKKAAYLFMVKVYKYLIYNDTDSLFDTMDFRENLPDNKKAEEHYLVFRYMLNKLRNQNPDSLAIPELKS